MRRRPLKVYWKRFGETQKQQPDCDTLLKILGATQHGARRAIPDPVQVNVGPRGRPELPARPSRPANRSQPRMQLPATHQPRRRRPRADLALLYAAVRRRRSLPHAQGRPRPASDYFTTSRGAPRPIFSTLPRVLPVQPATAPVRTRPDAAGGPGETRRPANARRDHPRQ